MLLFGGGRPPAAAGPLGRRRRSSDAEEHDVPLHTPGRCEDRTREGKEGFGGKRRRLVHGSGCCLVPGEEQHGLKGMGEWVRGGMSVGRGGMGEGRALLTSMHARRRSPLQLSRMS